MRDVCAMAARHTREVQDDFVHSIAAVRSG